MERVPRNISTCGAMGTRLDPAANERAAFRASLCNFLAYVMSPEELVPPFASNKDKDKDIFRICASSLHHHRGER